MTTTNDRAIAKTLAIEEAFAGRRQDVLDAIAGDPERRANYSALLLSALRRGDGVIIEAIIEIALDVGAPFPEPNAPEMRQACEFHGAEAVTQLLDRGMPVRHLYPHVLVATLERQDLSLLEAMIDRGLDPAIDDGYLLIWVATWVANFAEDPQFSERAFTRLFDAGAAHSLPSAIEALKHQAAMEAMEAMEARNRTGSPDSAAVLEAAYRKWSAQRVTDALDAAVELEAAQAPSAMGEGADVGQDPHSGLGL